MALIAVFAGGVAPQAHARSPLPQCGDNLDNDADGRIDYPAEPGCASPTGTSELDPATARECSDGIDNDEDGKVDFPVDAGCSRAQDDRESSDPVTQCSDGLDNDGDGRIDFPADPGCIAASDNSETDRACANGLDDDADGWSDFPLDWGCGVPVLVNNPAGPNQADDDEVDPPQCDDGRDNDGDGNVDWQQDPDCHGQASGTSEAPPPQCSDGLDNDGDGLVDFPLDPGCSFAGDDDEADPRAPRAPQCSDGLDNDGDGSVDLADPGCSSPADDDEADPPAAPAALRAASAPDGARRGRPLLTPFPVVRLRGRTDPRGVRVTLLTVRAPALSNVSVYCAGPACPRRRATLRAGRRIVRVRAFERRLRGGTTLKIYVTKSGYLGKYTRFRILRGRVPMRIDRCAWMPGMRPGGCAAP